MPSTSSFQPHQHHPTTVKDISRQIKMDLLLKNNLVLFISTSTSNTQRLAVLFVMPATAAPTEIRAMVIARFVGVVGLTVILVWRHIWHH